MSVLPPGVPSQPPFPSSLPDRGGLCGLTSAEWNLVLKLLLICECGASSLTGHRRTHAPGSPAVLFAFLVAFLVARVQSENISSLWLQVQGYAETTRMGTYLAVVLFSASIYYPLCM